tara:strand:- start:5182 stop:5676 length:495 start_codon:yes stop_codon:yes gene_type:complete
MKKIVSFVLALLIPLQGCATTSASTSSADYLRAIEEVEWVDLASSHRSPESARQILDEATGSGRDLLRVFTSDGDTVVVKDPVIVGDYVAPKLYVVGDQVVVEESIALEDLVRWQAGIGPKGFSELFVEAPIVKFVGGAALTALMVIGIGAAFMLAMIAGASQG